MGEVPPFECEDFPWSEAEYDYSLNWLYRPETGSYVFVPPYPHPRWVKGKGKGKRTASEERAIRVRWSKLSGTPLSDTEVEEGNTPARQVLLKEDENEENPTQVPPLKLPSEGAVAKAEPKRKPPVYKGPPLSDTEGYHSASSTAQTPSGHKPRSAQSAQSRQEFVDKVRQQRRRRKGRSRP